MTHERVDSDPCRAGAPGLVVGPDRDHAHLVAVQHVDRCRVEAGRVERDHRGIGLAR